MELWLDTCDLSLIESAKARGLLYGITTNPSILAAVSMAPLDIIKTLLSIQKGPVTLQMTASSAQEIIDHAKHCLKLFPRLIIKIPVSKENLIAIHALSQEGIPVMATVIYEPLQAISAFKAGAEYAAVYIGRMQDAGLDAFKTLETIQQYITRYCPTSKLIAASLRSKEHILHCLGTGCAAMTLGEKAYIDFVQDHPLTLNNMERFASALAANWIHA